MTALRLALAASAALAASPAVTPPTEGDPLRELKERAAAIVAAIAQARPQVERLDALRAAYPGAADPDALAAEREELRPRVIAALDELNRRADELAALNSDRPVREGAALLRQFLASGTVPVDPTRFVNDASEISRVITHANQFHDSGYLIVKAEETAFHAMQAARASRRRWLLALGSAGGLLAAAGAALLARRRRPATLTPELAVPSVPAALPAPAEPAPGTLLGGNFRIERELGRGGMGVVYLAADQTLRRQVAVKRMREELSADARELELFLSEARLVASLRHPCIVEIYSVLKEAGRVWLVFELVDGAPLSSFVGGGRRARLGSIKRVLGQVAAALDYSHGRRVVHRDLKPSNIMVARSGGVKVMDFGIARKASETVAKLSRTQAFGTPPYMAPEAELGEVSGRSDLFGLGVILYEMATGVLPFTGPNFLAQKRERRWVPPSRAVPGLPPALDAVVARALEPDPAGRFASAAELCRALDALPD